MSRQRFSRVLLVSGAIVAAASISGAAVAQPGPEAARLESFTAGAPAAKDAQTPAKPEANYFALSLRPAPIAPAPGPRDVVVLFNTSAAQVGEFRTQAREALDGLLGSLGPEDRVKLIAVDLDAKDMTKDFVAPKSPEMAAALAELDQRVPLGATDMERAIQAALGSLSPARTNPRALVYLGDGMSRANVLTLDKVDQLAESLVSKRVPVTAYLVGPRVDKQLLGTLAVESGGMVYEAEQLPPAQAGAGLAAAVQGTVLWPTGPATWPGGFSVPAKRTPPLRSDRDTVVLGTYPGGGPHTIQMSVDTPSGPQTLTWTVGPSPSKEDNGYLARLVDFAKGNAGLNLPLLGSTSLREAERAIEAGGGTLLQLAKQALSSGSLDDAARLADDVLRQDPQNPEAQSIKREAAKRRAGPTKAIAVVPDAAPGTAPGTDLNLVGAPGAGVRSDPFAGPGALGAAVEQERRVRAQAIQQEVINAINLARTRMSTDPAGVIQNLKDRLETVKKAIDLEPDVRDQLAGQLQAALREATQRQAEWELRRMREDENRAAAKERMLVIENLARKQEKMKQLMERFNALMEEGKYRYAEEATAAEAQQVDPLETTAQVATLHARAVGYWEEAMALRVARQKGMVDALYQVEHSHVPFPDEPPIVYPAADVWQQLTARRKEKYSSMDLASRGAAEKKITEALKSPTTLEFMETPLTDVVDYLKDLHKIEIQLDNKALGDVGVAPDTPITRNLKGVSLRSALRLMLRELDLTYLIDNEVLLITTPEQADARLATKVYPVADLVIPVQSTGMMGGFGGMGGMGGMGMMGGMGGMGMMGGMGGMGMGGMGMGGMGMGGMGMGGMGGGFFNLPPGFGPRNVLNGANGFRAFSVKDDLDLSADNQPAAPAPEKKSETKAGAVHPAIDLRPEHGVEAETAWDRYFAANKPSPGAVRETVRTLWKQQKYGQIVGLVRAALRRGHVQPWMYEAMAMAMLAEGRSPQELERVVMSAVEFAENPLDLMLIAAYLERLDLSRRALTIYQQVARMAPLAHEPYVAGLRVAQSLDDLEGIQWATVGILSQAWPEEQQEIWEKGRRVAAVTLERLRNEQRLDEAKRYEKALDEAVARDCVVILHWNGNADLDLLVREPGGTICSARNPRTAAGGVLLGDSFSTKPNSGADGYSEVYVCPKGFTGDYGLVVRRVWGKVAADKVTVDVYLHCRTAKEQHLQQTVTLKGDEAQLKFGLADGRRTESLKDFQVAKAAAGQVQVRQHILAQQLAAGVDPASMLALAQSRQLTNGGSTPFFPFVGRGAVGYQPVIIQLPEGANLMASAVISADRRYVRFTGVPFFSGVAEVNTFNTVTGEGGQGRGGTGGLGFGGLGFGQGTGGGVF